MKEQNVKKNPITIVRLESIVIQNFKNVKYGKLELSNSRTSAYQANILALYGQNGSGKSTLVDAMSLLKYLLYGVRVPNRFADYVSVFAEEATLTYEFSVRKIDEETEEMLEGISFATYQVSIARKKETEFQQAWLENRPEIKTRGSGCRVRIFAESLSIKEEGKRLREIFNSAMDEKTFGPHVKARELLLGKNPEALVAAAHAKMVCLRDGLSYAFSQELNEVFLKNGGSRELTTWFKRLHVYAMQYLFVKSSLSMGMSGVNELALSFRQKIDTKRMVAGTIGLHLDEPNDLPQEECDVVASVIDNLNIVLEKIVPGLTIGMESLGVVLSDDGSQKLNRVELVSYKNGRDKKIPLRGESEGIKKIISVLSLLTGLYNDPRMTVVVDELDSGVFEYLLGELLEIVSERGRGQLIFTSHNLRPLETLDRGFIAFTTTKPENRYVRMKNVGKTNNLRDLYYRNIVLGEQPEELYETTKTQEIACAFRKAGGVHGA